MDSQHTRRSASSTAFKAVVPAILLIAACASLCSCLDGGGPANDRGVERITFITTGIMQGNLAPFERHYSRGRVRRFGDPARVASVVKRAVGEARAKGRRPILLDLGDNLSGSAEALLTKGEIIARVLGDLGLDAALLGNLEFAHGQRALESYFKKYSIPFLAGNLSLDDGGKTPFAHSRIFVDAGRVRILLSGLVPPNLKFVCLPGNVKGLKVMEGLDAPFKKAFKDKVEGKAHLSVMLTQESLGTENPGLRKALDGSGIDLLFGLDFDREGEVRLLGSTRLLSFPGHNQGQRVRITEVDADPEVGIVKIDSWFDMVDADVEKPDPKINSYLEAARRRYRDKLDVVVARAAKYLNREFYTDGDTGNILTDAIREYYRADVAAINSGGVAGALAPGPILLRDLFRVIPYQNRVICLEVKGSDLSAFLEATLGRGSPLQVSGLSLRLHRKAGGQRGFVVKEALLKGSPIDPAKKYRLATNDFVLGRSPSLKACGDVQTGPLMRDVLAEYLKKHSPVARPARGRVRIDE